MTTPSAPGGVASDEAAGTAPVPSPTGARSARERVLDAAKRLFYRDGIRAIGVEAVVEHAGVTKMSLYRNFSSKDDLVAAYLSDRDRRYWQWWDAVVARHPGQPREQLRALFAGVAKVAAMPEFRGCPFTNAAIEFPAADHPGRRVAEANKQELRRRLRSLAGDLGAADAEGLGDQLVLLLEGAYVSSQVFGRDGPVSGLAAAAAALVAAGTPPG
ncbi:MAG: TetR family transcriptional regulator [Azospirillum sp.]|nr:TetR family transcriptional regulator [Azospirillum sp.]